MKKNKEHTVTSVCVYVYTLHAEKKKKCTGSGRERSLHRCNEESAQILEKGKSFITQCTECLREKCAYAYTFTLSL